MTLPTPGKLITIKAERGRVVRFAPRYAAVPSGKIWDIHRSKFVNQIDNGAGQPKITLTMPNKSRKTYYVSRLICDTLVMPLTQCMQVDHIDNDPTNNCETNLRPISAHNNNLRSSRRRRFIGKALSDTAVRDIRNLRAKGASYLHIAGIYGVNRRTIQKAAKAQSYKDVI